MIGRPTVRSGNDSTASRTGRHGAAQPARWARSWHAWRTGTPARLAAARMQATAANRAYGHKSSVCHQETSSSRSLWPPRLPSPRDLLLSRARGIRAALSVALGETGFQG